MGDLPQRGVSDLKELVVLGATGSIGQQTLEVADRLDYAVAVLAAGRWSSSLAAIAARHPSAAVIVAAEESLDHRAMVIGERLTIGREAVVEAAARPDAIVVNGIVGAAGLEPSLAALRAGNRLALANKETMVAGGPLVAAAARDGGGHIIPVDSEHSALFQCLVGEAPSSVRRLVLTASGGPFRRRTAADLVAITPRQALDHPTWDMGPRITIDSATMMNKALEVIEAHLLFGIEYDRIDVVIHPQSIVHSLVEFADGSVKAQLGEPDMRLPIQYAITHPDRPPADTSPFELAGRSLTFEAPDRATFPALDLGYIAGRRGGIAPAVMNAADEVAVAAFLDERIGFTDIIGVVATVLDRTEDRIPESIADVLDADAAARAAARAAIETHDLQR